MTDVRFRILFDFLTSHGLSQIFGGAGYSKDFPIERIRREVRVVKILDGTSEMMWRIVARYAFREADAIAPTGVTAAPP